MATKIEVLNNGEYQQYIMIALIQVSRDIIVENSNTAFHDKRIIAARQILQSPIERVNTFKSLCVVSFDTSNYENLTEAQKITGAKSLVGSVFNEGCYIF